jgi:hypothetical protein
MVSNTHMCALQLRLFVLGIPLPKVPPLLLAALTIPNTLDASALHRYSLRILEGLSEQNIRVVAYATDGAATERSVQHRFESDSTLPPYRIIHPDGSGTYIEVIICRVDGQVFVCIQDFKHASKTYRNNAFSGAKLMTIGDYNVLFRDILRMALHLESPIFKRDVVRVDRQDDNAATRLTSSGVLAHLVKHFPTMKALIIYLFVFGELVDAYQNRCISLIARLKMAFRAYFFIELWIRYLERTGHPVALHCLSSQALDITRMLARGLLGMVITFRDHMGGKRYPLLPWKCSTEMNEKSFAEVRKRKSDFSAYDFKYMVGQLQLIFDEAYSLMHSHDPKARANGSAFDLLDGQGVDYNLLSTYPQDKEISADALDIALAEAKDLLLSTGIDPRDLDPEPATTLPSMFGMISGTSAPPAPYAYVDHECGHVSDTEDNEPDVPELELETLIRYQETLVGKNDQHLNNLRFAGVAAIADEQREL